jgi:hypothetical protein
MDRAELRRQELEAADALLETQEAELRRRCAEAHQQYVSLMQSIDAWSEGPSGWTVADPVAVPVREAVIHVPRRPM